MKQFSLNIRGSLREFSRPLVMGILNVTPDSFYSGSRALESGSASPCGVSAVEEMAARLLAEGADIIDVGGCSTRPGSASVGEEEESRRVRLGVEAVRRLSSQVMVSVDTFRSGVARRSVLEWGADMINDISAGLMDREMIVSVADLKVPYIMMHTRGTPDTMGSLTDYPLGVVAGVASELRQRVVEATMAGVADIIVDPGFGFAKTMSLWLAWMSWMLCLTISRCSSAYRANPWYTSRWALLQPTRSPARWLLTRSPYIRGPRYSGFTMSRPAARRSMSWSC